MTKDGEFPRLFAWVSLNPQLLVLGTFVAFFNWLGMPWPVLSGCVNLGILSFALKRAYASDIRKGADAINAGKHLEAIPWFDRSAAFFQRCPWLDRYRYLLLLPTATMSYREVALVNGAFWIGRGRSGEEAREAFEAVLREFPESGFAKISRRTMFANDTHH